LNQFTRALATNRPEDRIRKLERLNKKISRCQLCKLSDTRIHPVTGEGNFHAKLMLVGEAPGRREDELGRPFVGRAGNILDQMLNRAGISRSDVFITNIVKCRPPRNRMPDIEERCTCMKNYLDREISLIKPIIICLMGRTAIWSFLGMKSVLPHRGKFIEQGNRNYFLTLHPAATIYNNKLRSFLEEDFLLLSRKIK
jgi:DNA polymerase